jgi:nucleolar protein 12
MSQGLSALFSDESKAVFARSQKPKEFSLKRAPTVVEEKVEKKEKKPKHKRRRPDEDATEAQPSAITASIATSSGDDKDSRTIFVGNISLTTTANALRKYISAFGEVESIRQRSVPVAGTAVDEHGNQDLVKKVCTNAKMFGTQKGSLNAYVVFKSAESVANALKADNSLVDGRHIRVDRLNPSMYDPKRSVFLGSLPFYVDEEELRNHFAKVLSRSGQT